VGPQLNPAQIEAFLRRASLLDNVSESALLGLATNLADGQAVAVTPREALDTLLGRLLHLDGHLLRERAGLDVHARECLRLAAAWHDWRARPDAH
jgi:hypothetical protein